MKKYCADPILELLGLGHLYHGDRPLVWIPDLYPKIESKTSFSEYFVDTKEDGPYASLLTDETFKKAFSPDTEQGKCNLLNLLNDMLEGQIPNVLLIPSTIRLWNSLKLLESSEKMTLRL